MKRVVLLFLLFMSANAAANGIHVAGGTYISYVDTKTGNKFSLLNDLRLGCRIDYSDKNSLAFLLATETQKQPNDIEDETRESFGVSIAYYVEQFYVMGAYFPNSQFKGGDRSATQKGSGMRF